MLSAGISTMLPRLSLRVRMPLLSRASARSCWTCVTEALVSTTSSRGAIRMPILTSMWVAFSLIGVMGFGGERPVADSPPGESGQHVLGGALVDRAVGAQPVPGADLGHSDQR